MNNTLKLTALAITPFIIGNIISLIGLTGNTFVYSIISILFFVYWLWVGLISNKLSESSVKSVLIGNSFGILSIILLLISGILLNSYFTGFLGLQLQMYFLPSIRISSMILSTFAHQLSSNILFAVSFILMIIFYIIGYFSGKKRV